MIDIVLGLWTFGWLVTSVMMITSTVSNDRRRNIFIRGFGEGIWAVIIAVAVWPNLLVDAVIFCAQDTIETMAAMKKERKSGVGEEE